MTEILRATHGSNQTPLVIGNVSIPCYVLEDGRRVLSGNGMQKALGFSGTAGDWLVRFANAKKNKPHMSEEIFAGLENRVQFIRPSTGGSISTTYGYEATLLIDFCDAIIEAKNAGDLLASQAKYARAAEMIIRSVAKVGIIALIDEATGYQELRPRDALQEYLNKFLRTEYARWVKRFPDEFFRLMFEMKGWTWDYASTKKPVIVGRYINDLVYQRLAPQILKELQARNPPDSKGRRKAKHHQFLTEEVGHPKLQEHLNGLMALQRASAKNWGTFLRLVERSYPKFGNTLPILFDEE